MLLLQISFMSPALVLIVAVAIVSIAKMSGKAADKIGRLAWTSAAFSVAGATATLILTVAWMTWYEKTTGYSAGNAPLGWIFFYGPLGAAFGQLVALALWCFKSRTVQS